MPSYYNVNNREYSNKNYFPQGNENENKINIKSIPSYKNNFCHYPLVPRLIKRRDYSFLEKFFDSFNEFPQK
ncbi:MAG TPA: hypothetical protein VJ583_01985 [Nitrososphaeraceae archaeon]|nr:hypothetical protein [Nitrososphaeraceae archaeon]